MASSSSSFPSEIVEYGFLKENEDYPIRVQSVDSSRLFDVFINHRGPDVKHTLALQLYNLIKKTGFRPFLDSQEIELGDSIPSTLKNAIFSSSVHVAIFSQGYVKSAWCLAELVLMLQSGVKIIPVFYDVAPADLRYIAKGVYAEEFAKYEEKGRYLSQLEEWKKALHTVSLISGYERNRHNNDNDKLCEIIVSAVLKEVERMTPLDVAKHSVGLDELVDDFESKCGRHIEKENFKIIGIFGIGGSGKTTLAKEFFNRKRSEYDRSSFLFDVREAAAKGELPSLQTKLLKDLFMEDHPKFQSTDEGISYLRYRLGKALLLRFLIVVDDIDHIRQLDALLVTDWHTLNPDNLLIVTTRDERMLIRASITPRYRMKEMNEKHSRELFCWHAFQQPYPSRGFEDLVQSFVKGCGGLPLSLQVLGGHVSGSSEQRYWQIELDKVRKTLPGDIKQRIQISYDSLDREEQGIFMDIACFFVGKLKSTAIRIWEGSGWKADFALQILEDKCLVCEGDAEMTYWEDKWLMMNKPDVVLGMHDHIRDFGREIADGQRPPCRFWCPQDLKSMQLKGFRNIIRESNHHSFRCFHSFFDSSVGGRITFFLGNSDDCPENATVLLSLELYLREEQLISIPSWIPLRNLQRLRVVFGRLKRLWYEAAQVPLQLKELVLQQISLEEISSSLEMLNELQYLVIKGKNGGNCILGTERSLTETLKKLTKLKGLILCQFRFSGKVSLKNGGESTSSDFLAHSLQTVQISDQQLACQVSISGEHCPNLESLHLESMENLIEIDLRCVSTLRSLTVRFCSELKTISRSFDMCAKPATLDIQECRQLGLMAYSRKLKTLSGSFDMKSFGLGRFDVEDLSGLEKTIINRRWNLQNVKRSELEGLKSLHLSSIGGGISKLSISGEHCPNLESVHLESMENLIEVHFKCLNMLNSLKLWFCSELKRISRSFDRDVNPAILDIQECQHLGSIAYSRKSKTLSGSFVMESFDPGNFIVEDLSALQRTVINESWNFQNMKGIELEGLKSLHLSGSEGGVSKLSISGEYFPNLESFQLESMENLTELNLTCLTAVKSLTFKSCRRLITVSGSFNWANKLATLKIKNCPRLRLLPSLADLRYLESIIIDGSLNLWNIDGTHKLEGLKRLHVSGGEGGVSKISIYGDHLPRLEFLHLEYMENLIELDLNRIMELKYLTLKSCTRLQIIEASFNTASKLAILDIRDCPELEVLRGLPSLCYLERIIFHHCWKLHTLQGIEKSTGLKYLNLSGAQKAIQDCISTLQRFPLEVTVVIGEATEDVNNNWSHLMSVLVPSLVGAHAICEIRDYFNDLNPIFISKFKSQCAFSAIIVCALFETSDSPGQLGILLPPGDLIETQVETGKWLASIFIAGQEHVNRAQQDIHQWIPKCPSDSLKNGFIITVSRGQEWEALVLLKLIIAWMYKRIR
ncbi:disease resistance protein Roq1 [Cryptomeria japonica]|uniref:disease resistance protein Roq1 n=1 Tax=Cryptomeria japonica TaxID=3369 RepID=UPI0027DAAFE9|nr:disease resistance protein Roq1 [Cryptomeria japonica]